MDILKSLYWGRNTSWGPQVFRIIYSHLINNSQDFCVISTCEMLMSYQKRVIAQLKISTALDGWHSIGL